jgi:hypothetical protein
MAKLNTTEPVFVNLLRSSGIDSQHGEIDSSESILGLFKRVTNGETKHNRARICKPLRSPGIDSQPGEIDSTESIPGLLKRLQIRVGFVLKGTCTGSSGAVILGDQAGQNLINRYHLLNAGTLLRWLDWGYVYTVDTCTN